VTIKSYRCAHCGRQFATQTAINAHRCDRDPQQWLCPVCHDPVCAASAVGVTEAQRQGLLALVHGKRQAGSIDDWAAKAADKIWSEIDIDDREIPSHERIAAIIALHAEPLVRLLRESRRGHHSMCDASQKWRVDHTYRAQNVDEIDGWRPLPLGSCTCGADAWNARIDKVLNDH